jgi:hypothetical protein
MGPEFFKHRMGINGFWEYYRFQACDHFLVETTTVGYRSFFEGGMNGRGDIF